MSVCIAFEIRLLFLVAVAGCKKACLWGTNKRDYACGVRETTEFQLDIDRPSVLGTSKCVGSWVRRKKNICIQDSFTTSSV